MRTWIVKKDGYLRKVLQKSLVFRQLSNYSVLFWHTDYLNFSFTRGIRTISKWYLKIPRNGIIKLASFAEL